MGGRVRVDLGPLVGNSPPVDDTDVLLLCYGGTPCSTTKTDAQGRFLFINIPPGNHVIRASHKGFYTETLPGFVAQDQRELMYSALYIERCSEPNCDPAKRSKKPLAVCE